MKLKALSTPQTNSGPQVGVILTPPSWSVRIVLIAICIVGLVRTVSGADIKLLPKNTVSSSIIRLGDIAEFEIQSDLTKAAATFQVSQAPPPGEKITLQSIAIKKKIIAQHKLPASLSWEGPATVTIFRRGVKIDSDQLEKIISDYIHDNSDILPEADIRFIPNTLPLPFMVPTGKLSYDVIPSNPGIIDSSRFSIIFKVNNRIAKNMSIRGRVEALGEVIVAAKSLRKGAVVEANDLTASVMQLSKKIDTGLRPSDFIGKKLKRSVRSGSPLYLSSVETLPVIFRGQRVKIVISSGSLFLTATGLAKNDGRLDQMIRVQNLNSNKILYCRVAAPGLVEVIL